MHIDALSVLCAQLTRDLLAIAKFCSVPNVMAIFRRGLLSNARGYEKVAIFDK